MIATRNLRISSTFGRAIEKLVHLCEPYPFAVSREPLSRHEHQVEPRGLHGVAAEQLARKALHAIAVNGAAGKALGCDKAEAGFTRTTGSYMKDEGGVANLAWAPQGGREGSAPHEAVAPGKAFLPGASGHAGVRPRRACAPWRGAH